MLKLKKKDELKKHIGTIHCSNPLSLVQRKISNALLHNAYTDLLKKDEHEIDIRQICELIGYDSNDHKLIKEALKKLLSTVIEWNLLNNNEQDSVTWTASSMLASVSIKGSQCRYTYSKRLKDLLYSPAVYGRISMEIQAKFKSSYALALYENCIRYQNLPYSAWFSVETFRQLMGVRAGKYKVFRDFKKRVIDQAVHEVNLYSNIFIYPELKRISRTVRSIRFKILEKDASDFNISSPLVGVLCKNWDFTHIEASSIYNNYKSEDINRALEYANNNIGSNHHKIKVSKRAYLRKILSSSSKKISKKADASQIYADYARRQEPTAQEMARKEKSIDDKFDKCISDIVLLAMKEEIVKEFEAYLEKEHTMVLWKYYSREKFDNRAVKLEFVNFCSSHTVKK